MPIRSLFSSDVVLQWDQIRFEPAGSAKMSTWSLLVLFQNVLPTQKSMLKLEQPARFSLLLNVFFFSQKQASLKKMQILPVQK